MLAISDGHVDVVWVRGLCLAWLCFLFGHILDGSDFGLISEVKLFKELFWLL